MQHEAGGLAVGVHTTQFAIHDPKIGLLEPVLAEADTTLTSKSSPGLPLLIPSQYAAVQERERDGDPVPAVSAAVFPLAMNRPSPALSVLISPSSDTSVDPDIW